MKKKYVFTREEVIAHHGVMNKGLKYTVHEASVAEIRHAT